MSNLLPVPPELQRLIEKRENEDRRKTERRSGKNRRKSDLAPPDAIESDDDSEQLPLVERRSGRQRRKGGQRRKRARRKTDENATGSNATE